ncbi:hypothetical protein [Tindallia californiensis]|uniref:Uncharacterized protein n=1 Tax=Tindallia californiensis TaxID=159292 RepID=A0A1H3NQ02_9FIRM|nr:hypothetical protein [Tindallia californiensis]SDY91017.1 hypothetical protein SAMN05192546_105230 [Tindallia californiensis]
MTIKPIDQQITVLNSVQESKNQQNQNNRAHTTNQFIQGQQQIETEKDKTRITEYDETQGQKINQDSKKNNHNSKQQKKRKKKKGKNDLDEESFESEKKGTRLDIKI